MTEIQQLRLHEVDRLRTLRLAALQDAPDAFASTFQEATQYSRDQWRSQLETMPTFVAVLDGVDSGMVRGAPLAGQPTVAYLLSLWVAPHARGRGVGDALMDALVDWGKTGGIQRLVLDVGDHNDAAIALYTRKGFKFTGSTGHLPPPRSHILEREMALDP